MQKFIAKLFLAFIVTLLILPFFFSNTHAHAALVRTDPPDNAVLEEMPEEMHLWFNEGINADFSTFKILDINGQTIKLDGIRRDKANDKHIILTMPELSEGVYSVHWQVLSAYDGHETQGFVVFGIGANADLSSAAAGNYEVTIPWAEVALRWFNYGLLALLTGAIIVRTLVLRPGLEQQSIRGALQQADVALVRWAWRFSLLAILIGLGLLFQQIWQLLDSLPDNATITGTVWQLLTKSRWGYFWLGRQFLLILLAAFWFWNRQSPTKQIARTTVLYIFLLTVAVNLMQVFNGHAAAIEDQVIWAITADLVHLLSVGAWLGGLTILILVLFPLLRTNTDDFKALVFAGWRPFGRIAAVAVLLLALTGIYSAGHQIATPDAMIKTVYGQTLLGKIGLMLLMGLFGLFNTMLLHPPVAAPLARLFRKSAGWTPFSLAHITRLIKLEIGVGAALLIAVGIITALPNPRGPEFASYPREHLLESMTQRNGDMVISFSAKPNLPGQNIFITRATSIRRPAPAEIMRVFLRFTYLEDEIGTLVVDAQDIGEAQYHLGGSYLSLPGEWLVEVVVRRKGLEDTVSAYYWTVPPTSEPPDIIISDRPLQPLTTAVTIAGFTAVLIFLTISLRRKLKKKTPPEESGLETPVSA